jgi:hypothetical protein
MKKTYLIASTALLIILAAVIFYACKKENELQTNTSILEKSDSNPIRSFASFDELNAEVEKTLTFTYDELVTYEKLINFNSFGKLAEQAMMPILQEVEAQTINSTKLAKALNTNSEYLQIVTDDEGEQSFETKYYKSSYRYIMNRDNMFRVEDTIYFKVFEGGHVSCHADYYSQLLNLSESDFSLLEDNDIFTVFKYSDVNRSYYGWSVEKIATSGNERVKVLLYISATYKTNPDGTRTVTGQFRICTTPQVRALWIWWPTKHTITNSMHANIYYFEGYHSNGILHYFNEGTTKDYKRDVSFGNINKTLPLGSAIIYFIYINGASGYGKIPSLTCNVNLN